MKIRPQQSADQGTRQTQRRITCSLLIFIFIGAVVNPARGTVLESTGGPTTTRTDAEVYFSPITGQVWSFYSDQALFGIGNSAGLLAVAFNTTSDGTIVVAPNTVDRTNVTVSRLAPGTVIGSGSLFDNTEYTLAEVDGLVGNWNTLGAGFFGFAFGSGTDVHYGWANIIVLPDYNVTLNSFAYETVAGQPIAVPVETPEPSSMALVGVFGICGLLFSIRRRLSRRALQISLLTGMGFVSRMASAQTAALPGQTDPVGSHLVQFRSDHLFSITDNFQNTLLNTFGLQYSANPFSVSLNNTPYSVQDPWYGIRQFHAASGRFLQPDHDDVVLVNGDGANIDVQIVGQPAAAISLPGVLPRYVMSVPGSTTQQPTVDFIAVAAADLDHAVDSSGNYHDEVVIAYVAAQNDYQLIVLDFSNTVANSITGNITVQQPKIVHVQALDGLQFDPSAMFKLSSQQVGIKPGILPFDNVLSISAGDYDGDGSAEIAVCALDPSGTELDVQTLRYRPELANVFEIGLQKITAPNLYVDTLSKSLPAYTTANVTTTSGDYEGRGADDLALGYLAWVPANFTSAGQLVSSFSIHLLNDPMQATPITANFLPGNPTIVTVNQNLTGRIPQQLTITGAAYPWTVLNGTWPTTLTSASSNEVIISLPVDTSSIRPSSSQTITAVLSTGVGPASGTPPLYFPMSNFQGNVVDDYPKLQLVSGLFKYDPSNGWDFSRRQFAAIWNEPQGCQTESCVSSAYKIGAIWYSVSNQQGKLQFNQEGSTEIAAPVGAQAAQRVAATAGAFRGNTILNTNGTGNQPPIWSLAINAWYSNAQDYLYTLEPNGSGFNMSAQSFPTNSVDTEERLAVVNYDADGSSLYLGAPIRLSASNLYTPTTILEEPPKHLAWLNGSIFNLNRNDGFNVQLAASSTEQVSTSTQQQSSSDFATTQAVSASLSVKTTVFPGISNQFSAEDTAKFSYDTSKTESSYYSINGSLSYSSGAETDHDDLLQALTQNLTIWRYRVYNSASSNSSSPGFYDLTYPNSPYNATGAGLNTDWYNPIHENGNILSYPPPPSNGLPDDVGSPYKVNGQPPPNLSNGILYSGKSFCFGGVSGPQTITMTGVSSSGDTVESSKSFSWDNDTQVADTVKVTGSKISASYDADFGGKQSTSTATASDNTTTGSTSVTFNVDDGDDANAYNLFPVFYNSNAGVLKFVHYVSIPTSGSTGECTSGGKWWTDHYGGAADPALNLPFRFSFGGYDKNADTTTWNLQTDLQREQLRGFFLTSATANTVESTPNNPVYTPLATNPAEGGTVRMAVRVYNFSLSQPATGVTAQFSVVPYDSARDNELACGSPGTTETGRSCASTARTLLGVVALPSIPAWGSTNNWTTAEYIWTIPQGFIAAHQNSPEFRVYVNLSSPGPELNGPELPCNHALTPSSPCPLQMAVSSADPNWDPNAPGQNNEGYSYVTLQTASAQNAAAASEMTMQKLETANDPLTARGELGRNDLPSLNLPTKGFPAFNLKTTEDSLVALDPARRPKVGLVIAYQGRPLRVRVKAISEHGDVQGQQKALVFDGSGPDQKLIAAKAFRGVRRLGTAAWFEWTPTKLGLHQLRAEILEPQEDEVKGDNLAKLSVIVVRAPGDVNGDGSVDGLDTAIIMDQMGKSTADSTCGKACDLNGDGRIGRADLELAMEHCNNTSCAISHTLPSKKMKKEVKVVRTSRSER